MIIRLTYRRVVCDVAMLRSQFILSRALICWFHALQETGMLLHSVETARAEIAPRKKFAFRSRRTGPGSAHVARINPFDKNAVKEARPPAVAGEA